MALMSLLEWWHVMMYCNRTLVLNLLLLWLANGQKCKLIKLVVASPVSYIAGASTAPLSADRRTAAWMFCCMIFAFWCPPVFQKAVTAACCLSMILTWLSLSSDGSILIVTVTK
jgi:hypothetical protein